MVETKLPKKREAQETYPALCPNWLSAEYQSPCGAQETDGGLQDWPRREGAMGGIPGFQTEILEGSSLGSVGEDG